MSRLYAHLAGWLAGEACSLGDLERQLWRRLLPIADWNGDGTLSLEEFTVLMHVSGLRVTPLLVCVW